MSLPLALMLALLSGQAARKPSWIPAVPRLEPRGGAHLSSDTACEKCHVTANWKTVKFNHARTGFILKGEHEKVSCQACHGGDFRRPLPTLCFGCHQDAHQGALGGRCEGCHDEESWRTSFTAEAHQRTQFPLFGAHAILPCQECHSDARDRRFARPAVSCIGCHQVSKARTSGLAVDHFRLGFSDECQQCHSGYRFRPARFPGHDACYLISSGAHAAIACEGCHTSLQVMVQSGTCSTQTASCTGCHTHQCTAPGGATPTDKLHLSVAGYQCADRKCYECHQLSGGAP